jgi:hypothetical protein
MEDSLRLFLGPGNIEQACSLDAHELAPLSVPHHQRDLRVLPPDVGTCHQEGKQQAQHYQTQ